MSYGPNFDRIVRKLATYIDKIFRGASPQTCRSSSPAKFELVINLKTTKALGLDIPPTLLARADPVIE
jgi:putative ABC transport system substrate-binding protein